APISSTWMKPPIVVALTIPSAHSSNNPTAIVNSITAPLTRVRPARASAPWIPRKTAHGSQDELDSHAVNDAHPARHRRPSAVDRAPDAGRLERPPDPAREPGDPSGRPLFRIPVLLRRGAVHPVRRRVAGHGGQTGRRVASPPRLAALGGRARHLRRPRLHLRRDSDAGRSDRGQPDRGAGGARPVPLGSAADRAPGGGWPHPPAHPLV